VVFDSDSIASPIEAEPPHHEPETSQRCRRFLREGLGRGEALLDVGCGDGELLEVLKRQGGFDKVFGLEIDPELTRVCHQRGLFVIRGRAEAIPLASASLDAVVCSVVIPYTDSRRAIREWSRILKPGGLVHATYHGWGFGWDYLLHGAHFKKRFYGLRMLVNSVVYDWSGRRLPGFLGDTLCQSAKRLRLIYDSCGLTLEREEVIETVAGAPRFLGHRLRKTKIG
jgi:SAM-dependent methyltransferase